MRDKYNLILKLCSLTIIFIGALVFLYPFVVDALNSFIGQQRVAYYRLMNPAELTGTQEMQQKNQRLAQEQFLGGDPFGEPRQPQQINENYYRQHLLGVLAIPQINLSVTIFDETNYQLLERGVTLLQNTSYPIGGENTHSVITGHSGLPEMRLFTDLKKLKKGDQFFIEVNQERLAYEVQEIKEVLPEDLTSIKIRAGEDLVTLLTCTPYMINTHRLLVTGFRIPYEQKTMDSAVTAAENYQSYYLILLVMLVLGVSLAFLYFLWRSGIYYLSKKRQYELMFYFYQGDQPQAGTTFYLIRRHGNQLPLTAVSDSAGRVLFSQVSGGTYQVTGPQIKIKAKIRRLKEKNFRLSGHQVKKAKGSRNYFVRREEP